MKAAVLFQTLVLVVLVWIQSQLNPCKDSALRNSEFMGDVFVLNYVLISYHIILFIHCLHADCKWWQCPVLPVLQGSRTAQNDASCFDKLNLCWIFILLTAGCMLQIWWNMLLLLLTEPLRRIIARLCWMLNSDWSVTANRITDCCCGRIPDHRLCGTIFRSIKSFFDQYFGSNCWLV